MGGVSAVRWLACVLGALLTLVGVTPRASAFEAFDGRFQLHGFFEEQIRGLARDLQTSDGLDLAQWYNVLNLEAEYDLAQNGWGPFSSLSTYARFEVRYDCVWTRGCGMFTSANAYGNRAERLPDRLIDGHRSGFTGVLQTRDQRSWAGVPLDQIGFEDKDLPYNDRNKPAAFFQLPTFSTLLGSKGIDGVIGSADDPAAIVFAEQLRNCIFGARKIRGAENGHGTQLLPWNSGCKLNPRGELRHRANPFNPNDTNPALASLGPGLDVGGYALPFRPSPDFAASGQAPGDEAQGIYYPNQKFAALVRKGRLGSFDQNFRQEELEWNRGASQQDEKELKEAYLDAELLDGRLWFRIGKQNIVWGKTELFRTTDQFNPQDLALASLPSLEESRIALWSIRGIYSFYSVGPLEDLRLELAANFDQMEPTDLGRCGEPYSPNPVCDKTAGLLVHGLTALGVAGEVRPKDPWESTEGVEFGARLEFRWDRFSFQFSDFWGYSDIAFADQLFAYSRNVDPATGRPRQAGAKGSCTTGTEDDCLEPDEALRMHSANQQVFAMICATSIGFSNLDRSVCAQSVLNSRATGATAGVPLAEVIGILLRGSTQAKTNFFVPLAVPRGVDRPAFIAAYNTDANLDGDKDFNDVPLVFLTDDGALDGVNPLDDRPDNPVPAAFNGLDGVLSDEQEALLGCGPFFSSSCNIDGIDLLNAEGSAVIQSWPGIEGTFGDWSTTDGTVAQPGTTNFLGGPICTRYVNGQIVLLPGCRGPQRGARTDLSAGYNVAQDGTPPDLQAVIGLNDNVRHPFTQQLFASEMAAVSWNALMGFVALSFPLDGTASGLDAGTLNVPDVRDPASSGFISLTAEVEENHFDPLNPMRLTGCSFIKVQLCSNIQSIFSIVGTQRNTIRAGGNGRFGRRDLAWHAGSDVVLRYDKRNVLGFALDFAEDVSKTNWSMEATWISNSSFTNNGQFDGISEADTYNLTVSVDRPTFINFLNANRTFFFNSQWFFQFVKGYERSFTTNGPVNVLGTFTVTTGYFQDRLLPSVTFVYDVESASGAALPQIQYRFTEAFSATFGLAGFWGRLQQRDATTTAILPGNRAGTGAYRAFVENGLSAVRDRDEVFLRVRYTF